MARWGLSIPFLLICIVVFGVLIALWIMVDRNLRGLQLDETSMLGEPEDDQGSRTKDPP